jgi:hypothetical protein
MRIYKRYGVIMVPPRNSKQPSLCYYKELKIIMHDFGKNYPRHNFLTDLINFRTSVLSLLAYERVVQFWLSWVEFG